jgi:hypothetical protein
MFGPARESINVKVWLVLRLKHLQLWHWDHHAALCVPSSSFARLLSFPQQLQRRVRRGVLTGFVSQGGQLALAVEFDMLKDGCTVID